MKKNVFKNTVTILVGTLMLGSTTALAQDLSNTDNIELSSAAGASIGDNSSTSSSTGTSNSTSSSSSDTIATDRGTSSSAGTSNSTPSSSNDTIATDRSTSSSAGTSNSTPSSSNDTIATDRGTSSSTGTSNSTSSSSSDTIATDRGTSSSTGTNLSTENGTSSSASDTVGAGRSASSPAGTDVDNTPSISNNSNVDTNNRVSNPSNNSMGANRGVSNSTINSTEADNTKKTSKAGTGAIKGKHDTQINKESSRNHVERYVSEGILDEITAVQVLDFMSENNNEVYMKLNLEIMKDNDNKSIQITGEKFGGQNSAEANSNNLSIVEFLYDIQNYLPQDTIMNFENRNFEALMSTEEDIVIIFDEVDGGQMFYVNIDSNEDMDLNNLSYEQLVQYDIVTSEQAMQMQESDINFYMNNK